MIYKNTRNEDLFLINYATESRGKPLIDEQIEAVVVHVLLENNLGYIARHFGESKTVVENALRSEVALFKFV